MKRFACLLLAFGLLGCPPVPVPKVDLSKLSVADFSVGQKKGDVILQWKDPAADNLKEIAIVVKKSDDDSVVLDEKVAAGVQTFTIANGKLEVGVSYKVILWGVSTEGEKTTEIVYPYTVSKISLMFTKTEVFDTFGNFALAVDGTTETITLSWTGDYSVPSEGKLPKQDGSKEVSVEDCQKGFRIDKLMPGISYTFTATSADKQASALYNGKCMLFYDEFDYSDKAEILKRWKHAPRTGEAGDTKNNGWSAAITGTDSMIDMVEKDGVNYISLKGQGSGAISTSLDPNSGDKGRMGSGIRSKDQFYLTYGKIEIRARIIGADKSGHFPALWLMPQKGTVNGWNKWPVGGEVDIMEHVTQASTQIYQTLHLPWCSYEANGWTGNPTIVNNKGQQALGKASDWEEWNVFGWEWKKNGLYWYINDVHSKTYNRGVNADGTITNLAEFPFTDGSAFYLKMNMGVSNGGFAWAAAEGFKASLDVDYVKVTPNEDTIIQTDCPYYQTALAVEKAAAEVVKEPIAVEK